MAASERDRHVRRRQTPPLVDAADIVAARGLLQLGVASAVGVTSLAQAVHEAVLATAPLPWLPGGPVVRGVTRVAYGGVRSVTGVVGKGGDALLAAMERLVGGDASPLRPRTVSVPPGVRAVLNGIVGDRLERLGNPLALRMSIEPHRFARRSAHRQANGPRVLFIHGLCMDDRHWQAPTGTGDDFGDRLARDAGYRPLYLRYNTGLAIAENGRRLAALLEARHRGRHAWQAPLHIVAHSLGGLVIRSAIAEGVAQDHAWPAHLNHVVCLGTPHDGAPLERLGKTLDAALSLSRFSSPWAVIGKIRSLAIHQLGDAHITPWTVRPQHLRLHALAGVLGTARSGPASFLGDGLVPVSSALAEGHVSSAVGFDHRQLVEGAGHLALIRHPAVAAYLAREIT